MKNSNNNNNMNTIKMINNEIHKKFSEATTPFTEVIRNTISVHEIN